jgi:hypothetical protein
MKDDGERVANQQHYYYLQRDRTEDRGQGQAQQHRVTRAVPRFNQSESR